LTWRRGITNVANSNGQRREVRTRATVLRFLLVTVPFTAEPRATPNPRSPERAKANDNRSPAGTLRHGLLTLRIEARIGVWSPNGEEAPGVSLPAFAEEGHGPLIPGPLIRATAGTDVEVTLRNRLNDTLVVHGLRDRLGGTKATPVDTGVHLGPGDARSVRFRLETPGTFYYWGTTTHREIDYRTGEDAQLTGAIVVDPAGAPPPKDRILVIGMWTDTVARAYTLRKRILGVVNGVSWPHTERLRYTVGDTVRWRVINASGDGHPMHLHGFYYRIDSRSDGEVTTDYAADVADRVVTENLSPGYTMRITWVASRPGNWLFHCHIPEHIGPRGPLGLAPTPSANSQHTATHDAAADMGGLVVGIEIRPAHGEPVAQGTSSVDRRRLRLVVRRNGGGSDDQPFFGFQMHEGAESPGDSGLHVGPPLVLRQGQPVSITVVNMLAEPTSVHWHGIELESYYDGVAGFSGAGDRTAPTIAAGDSFEVRFTPPRAGTFIYHTHVDEERQEPAGLAGPIIVLPPGAHWDTATDHPVLITSPWDFEQQRHSVLVNASAAPSPLVLRAGVPHRLRFINMTLRRPALNVELWRDTTLLTWRELAKDAAEVAAARRAPQAARLPLSIGETVDVEIMPERPGDLRLEVRLGGRPTVQVHPLFATLPVRVVAADP